jgi:hypothetical protein
MLDVTIDEAAMVFSAMKERTGTFTASPPASR